MFVNKPQCTISFWLFIRGNIDNTFSNIHKRNLFIYKLNYKTPSFLLRRHILFTSNQYTIVNKFKLPVLWKYDFLIRYTVICATHLKTHYDTCTTICSQIWHQIVLLRGKSTRVSCASFLLRNKQFYQTITEILFPANLITSDNQIEIIWKYFAARSYCLSFYYHMFGYNMGDLTVSTQNGTQSALSKWSTSGDYGDVWVQVPGIDLKHDPQTKVHPFYL